MTWALVASSPAADALTGSGTTIPVTLGAAVSTDQQIIVGVELRSGDGVALTNITDDLGNSYEQMISPFDEATNTGRVLCGWICKDVTNAGTPVITANFDGAAFTRCIHVAAFSGGHLTAPGDKTATGTAASGTALDTASMTPAEDNELFWGFAEHSGEIPAGAGGFTILATNSEVGQSATAYLIQTSAAADTVSMSTTTTGAWAIIGVTLKQSGAPEPPGPSLRTVQSNMRW